MWKALVQLLLDALVLAFPGAAEVKQGVAVAEDALTIAESIYAWSKTPLGVKTVADCEALVKVLGGSVTRSASGDVASYVPPTPAAWATVGGTPNGANRGGLMPPGM